MVGSPVRRLLAPNPSLMTGEGTNTYLFGEREIVVVDPGPAMPAQVDAILALAAGHGGEIVALLVTHGHPDHLPAARTLRDRTRAPIFGHERLPDVDRPLRDGEVVKVGDEAIVAYETPGHADDHLAFARVADRSLFAGDLIAGVGTVVLSRTPGSLTRYLASLERIRDMHPTRIYPGHGPVVEDPAAKLQEYLDHRALRERQIVGVLSSGPSTVDWIVQRLYVGTPAPLLPMAARNVQAHLEHLANQGRATRSVDTWLLIDSNVTPEPPTIS